MNAPGVDGLVFMDNIRCAQMVAVDGKSVFTHISFLY